jgi:hypothetical protein
MRCHEVVVNSGPLRLAGGVCVVQEVDLGRGVTGALQENRGVSSLLRAVSDDVQQKGGQREPVLRAKINHALNGPIVEAIQPGPHLGLVVVPCRGEGFDGPEVVIRKFNVPRLPRFASQPPPPAALNVEGMHERSSDVPIRNVSGRDELLRGQFLRRTKDLAGRPVGVIEESLQIRLVHSVILG